MKRSPQRFLAVCRILSVSGIEAAAQCQTEKLFPSTPGFAQTFGHSVAIDGDTLMVGTQGGGPGLVGSAPAFQTDAAGSASRQVDFTAAPAGAGPGAIQAGSTWFFQGWYRDPDAGGAGFNLSDGLEACF